MKVAVIDYGRGNIHSVCKAVTQLGAEPVIAAEPTAVSGQGIAILPGTGAFSDAMTGLAARGLDTAVRGFAAQGKPLLGICLGMQALMTQGDEGGTRAGLGWIPGTTRLLRAGGRKLPHTGWNSVEFLRGSDLTAGIPSQTYFYFAHSYAVVPEDGFDVIGLTCYGERFAAMIGRGRIWGVQFHPEKSGRQGLRLLANFLSLGGDPR